MIKCGLIRGPSIYWKHQGLEEVYLASWHIYIPILFLNVILEMVVFSDNFDIELDI
jgi:hypothetical protein